MGKFVDWTGKQRGEWLVLSRAANRTTPGGLSRIYWLCRCSCGKEVEVSALNLGNGASSRCWDCGRKHQAISVKKFPSVRFGHLNRQYNLSPISCTQLLEKQDYKCAICREPVNGYSSVDHDHACCAGRESCGKCIRGILCQKCNSGLGMFNDAVKLVTAALQYLKGRLS